MAKKNKKPTQEEVRTECMQRFRNILSTLIVIDGATKAQILNIYHNTDVKLRKMKLTKNKWSKLDIDLYSEYNDIEKQFKMLNIFSDKFYSVLYLAWYELIESHNPYNFN